MKDVKKCEACGRVYLRRKNIGRVYFAASRFCSRSCRATKLNPLRAVPIVRRFWEKVDRRSSGECWPWKAGTDSHGYGQINAGGRGRPLKASRVAYELSTGRTIPPRMEVRHTCDNPPCCNPAHLVVGTHAQNMADMAARGRARNGRRVRA